MLNLGLRNRRFWVSKNHQVIAKGQFVLVTTPHGSTQVLRAAAVLYSRILRVRLSLCVQGNRYIRLANRAGLSYIFPMHEVFLLGET
jgi:hypothetical protein